MSLKTWNIIFIQLPDSGYITVKKSSRTPEEVMKSLKLPCDVIKTILGTFHLEKSIKAEFEPYSVSNYEGWYHPVPELLERIDSIEDYDGEGPPPPPPEPKVRRRYERYEINYRYCCGCNGQFEEHEWNNLIDVGEAYRDYGNVHWWGAVPDHGYLCRECALEGGLTNIIYLTFFHNRETHPFWDKRDEEFLSRCSADGPPYESRKYVWVKASVATRHLYALFISQHPTANINDAKDFVLTAFLPNEEESEKLSKKNGSGGFL